MSVSVVIAFAVNTFSPNGIAWVGQWDTAKGVITAKVNNHILNHDLEIDNVLDAKKIFDSGQAVFVDARSFEAYSDGHIKGAVSLPVMEFDLIIKEFMEQHNPSQFIITYCSGRECEDSHDLAERLVEAGFQNVSVYIDGYELWEQRDYPIEQATALRDHGNF